VAGVVAAVGHHLYYAHLDGQPAQDQLKKIRYGTVLAFFVKSTLVGTSIMCNRQRIWRIFRRKTIVIGITFCFILIGAWSIHQNGVASDVLFSRIMATTRNPTLDHLSTGACLEAHWE
jgi:hypothetical protein